MQFDGLQVIHLHREPWEWGVPEIRAVISVSSMGNVYLEDKHGDVLEDLSGGAFRRDCRHDSRSTSNAFLGSDDWQMSWIVSEMVELHGEPAIGECFGLMIPAVFGGEHAPENVRKRSPFEDLRYAGDVARQAKDHKDRD